MSAVSAATLVSWTRSHLNGPETFAVVEFLDGLVAVAVPDAPANGLRPGLRMRLSNRDDGGLEAAPQEPESDMGS